MAEFWTLTSLKDFAHFGPLCSILVDQYLDYYFFRSRSRLAKINFRHLKLQNLIYLFVNFWPITEIIVETFSQFNVKLF